MMTITMRCAKCGHEHEQQEGATHEENLEAAKHKCVLKREPFPLFPITEEEREILLKAKMRLLSEDIRFVCNAIGWVTKVPAREHPLAHKIAQCSAPFDKLEDYWAELGRYDLVADALKSRLHWLTLLINQPTTPEA